MGLIKRAADQAMRENEILRARVAELEATVESINEILIQTQATRHLFRSALEELESFADSSDEAGQGHLSTMLVRQIVRHALNP